MYSEIVLILSQLGTSIKTRIETQYWRQFTGKVSLSTQLGTSIKTRIETW